ncbi:MAG: response regulator [Myxococcota bacterium]
MAAGDEVLIVDAIQTHREGMRRLFDEEGYVTTALDNVDDARDLVCRKFFPAALVDLDVGRPGAGIDLARMITERSRQTAVVLLTGRRSFDAVTEALRLGVVDVVLKRPDHIDHLLRTVELACERYRVAEGGELLRDVVAVMDDAFAIMLDMARNECRSTSESKIPFQPRVLIVEQDPRFLEAIAQELAAEDWEVLGEVTGGGALDKASGQSFDVVSVREDLPDLRGTMVMKSLQASSDSIGLVYGGDRSSSRLQRFERGRADEVERPFGGPKHLAERIRQAVAQLGQTRRDREVIRAFRRDHDLFFRRFAELKIRAARLAE